MYETTQICKIFLTMIRSLNACSGFSRERRRKEINDKLVIADLAPDGKGDYNNKMFACVLPEFTKTMLEGWCVWMVWSKANLKK